MLNAPCITGEVLTCDRTHPRFGGVIAATPYYLEEEAVTQRRESFCPKLWEHLNLKAKP